MESIFGMRCGCQIGKAAIKTVNSSRVAAAASDLPPLNPHPSSAKSRPSIANRRLQLLSLVTMASMHLLE